jgi:hypothetical protein
VIVELPNDIANVILALAERIAAARAKRRSPVA